MVNNPIHQNNSVGLGLGHVHFVKCLSVVEELDLISAKLLVDHQLMETSCFNEYHEVQSASEPVKG